MTNRSLSFLFLGIGFPAGRNTSEPFAWFLYSLVIWDNFYYVFLWLLISWPASMILSKPIFVSKFSG